MKFSANLIPLFIVIPLCGAFLIALVGRRVKGFPDLIGFLSSLGLLVNALLALAFTNIHGTIVYSVGAWKPPMGIAMVVDGFSVFMLVTVNLVAFFIVIYSIAYMEKFTSKWKFYTLLLLMLGGMNGVIVTGDIFNLFVFLEIAAIASFSLVAFGTDRQELEAAFKYAVMSTVGSLFVLLGIALLYGYTSTLNMADMAQVLAQKGKTDLILFVSVLFIMGFGLKGALVPFHAWLPDAHPSAPAPISAMLSGVLIKSLGIYTLARIFYHVIGIPPMVSSVFMVLGTISMLLGGFAAIGQWDFKRLLAYSSISQMGYIFLGLGLGTPLGIMGALFHLFNHSVFKSLLFLNAGAIEYSVGTRDLQKLGGLGKVMPVTGATNLIGAMSISGIPPFNGFWSKLLIIIAAVEAGRLGFAVWAVVASILTFAAYLKALKYTFSGSFKNTDVIKEVPNLMKISLVSLSLICVLGGGIFLTSLRNVFLLPAVNSLLEKSQYSDVILEKIRQL